MSRAAIAIFVTSVVGDGSKVEKRDGAKVDWENQREKLPRMGGQEVVGR